MTISGTQLDKLGQRLANGEPSVADIAALQAWVYEHDEPLRTVAQQISGGLEVCEAAVIRTRLAERLGEAEGIEDSDLLEELVKVLDQSPVTSKHVELAPTYRLKSLRSIRSKLERESMRLRQMGDIAGLRVIAGDTRVEQNAVVYALKQMYPGAREKDRRREPKAGYRAVHVLIEVDGKKIEIQVRTWLQQIYAEQMEKMGDLIGRGIRYGEPPERKRVRGLPISSDRALKMLLDLGQGIEDYETITGVLALLDLAQASGLSADAERDAWQQKARRAKAGIQPMIAAKRWIDRRQPVVDPAGGRYVLTVYVPGEDDLVHLQEFTNYGAALVARAEWETRSAANWPGGAEVVVLGADSESNVKTTHGRYFHTLDELGWTAPPTP